MKKRTRIRMVTEDLLTEAMALDKRMTLRGGRLLPTNIVAELLGVSQTTAARMRSANYEMEEYKKLLTTLHPNHKEVEETKAEEPQRRPFALFRSRPSAPTKGPNLDLVERLENDFTYHAPFGDQTERYEKIRQTLKEVAIIVATLTPVSREQSLAFTKLEEAMFFANAAIARHEKE